MLEVWQSDGLNDRYYTVSGSKHLFTDEQVAWVYSLGKNRSPDTEICYTKDVPEIDDYVKKIKDSKKSWKTVGIIFIVLFSIAAIVILLAVVFLSLGGKLAIMKRTVKKKKRDIISVPLI